MISLCTTCCQNFRLYGLARASLQARRAYTISRKGIRISTRPVAAAPDIPSVTVDHKAFLSFVLAPNSHPLHFKSTGIPQSCDVSRELIDTLRYEEDRLVEIELGRYDHAEQRAFDRISMRLGQYLDWLDHAERSDGSIDGKQVYLAQWRGRDDLPGLTGIVKPPPLLAPLLSDNSADLYQTSFFIGPTNAVTPLHYDPYFNLYHLHASSGPSLYAKHFVLLPPSSAEFVKRTDTHTTLRNTSAIDIYLRPRTSNGRVLRDEFDVLVDPATPSRLAEHVSAMAISCILREGETLFIPRGWWHRVENVSLLDTEASRRDAGWTAGVGWWFLPRRT